MATRSFRWSPGLLAQVLQQDDVYLLSPSCCLLEKTTKYFITFSSCGRIRRGSQIRGSSTYVELGLHLFSDHFVSNVPCQSLIVLHVGIRKRRFHGKVITVNRCVGIAWDNKRVSPETVTTKGPLSNNGSHETRYHYL
jgi:hypothetical protein